MEQSKNIQRSEIWEQIYKVVRKIPRTDVDGDAADAPSVATELEELFLNLLFIQDVSGSPLTFMEKFKELVSLCKASVKISVNDHKDYYESVEEHINGDKREDIEKEVFEEMIKRDTVIRVQVYPHTPIGFYVVYHYDIDMALDIALDVVKNEK